MTKEKIVRMTIKQLAIWADLQKSLDGQKITPRDFDCWMAGYISGITFPEDIADDVAINVKEIVDAIIDTNLVKSFGVTGTSKEQILIVNIEEE